MYANPERASKVKMANNATIFNGSLFTSSTKNVFSASV